MRFEDTVPEYKVSSDRQFPFIGHAVPFGQLHSLLLSLDSSERMRLLWPFTIDFTLGITL